MGNSWSIPEKGKPQLVIEKENISEVESLKPGDLVRIDRTVRCHWCVYIGDEQMIHLIPKDGIFLDNIFSVADGDVIRSDNSNDNEHDPLPVDEIIQRAKNSITTGDFWLYNDSKHFAMWCRSKQVLIKRMSKPQWVIDIENIREIESLKPGDLVKMRRQAYCHWCVYIGVHKGEPQVIHLAGRMVGIVKDNIFEVANGNVICKDNSYDKKRDPLPTDEIIQQAENSLTRGFWRYHILVNNCEHFAMRCRYGVARSKQGIQANVGILCGTVAACGLVAAPIVVFTGALLAAAGAAAVTAGGVAAATAVGTSVKWESSSTKPPARNNNGKGESDHVQQQIIKQQ